MPAVRLILTFIPDCSPLIRTPLLIHSYTSGHCHASKYSIGFSPTARLNRENNAERTHDFPKSGQVSRSMANVPGTTSLAMNGVECTKADKEAVKAAWSKVSVGTEVDYTVKRQGEKVGLRPRWTTCRPISRPSGLPST